jgi:hypothetical protein
VGRAEGNSVGDSIARGDRMGPGSSQMDDHQQRSACAAAKPAVREEDNVNGTVWKYVAISALSCIVGIFGGSYNPNRNLATHDDIQKEDQRIDGLEQEVTATRLELQETRGELKAKKMLIQ